MLVTLSMACGGEDRSPGPDGSADAGPRDAGGDVRADTSVADSGPGDTGAGPGYSCDRYCDCVCPETAGLCVDGDVDGCLARCGYDLAAYCRREHLPLLGGCATCDDCNSPAVCM